MGVVDVKHTQEHELTIEWESSSSNDMIADSTLALVTGIDRSPASVKRMFYSSFITCTKSSFVVLFGRGVTTNPNPHSHCHPHADFEDESSSVTRIQRLGMFLEAHFGDVELHMPEISPDEPAESGSEASFWVRLDDTHAQISLISMVINGRLFCNVRQLMDFLLLTERHQFRCCAEKTSGGCT
jgi:cleavage and polyadenylation specificity factor subunit 3